jgi:hypothetical protein
MPKNRILPAIQEDRALRKHSIQTDNLFAPSTTTPVTYYAYLPGDVDIYLKQNTLKSITSLPRENFFRDGESALQAAREKYPTHAITLFKLTIAQNELSAIPEKTNGKIKIIWNLDLVDHLQDVIGISRGKDYSQRKIYEFSIDDIKDTRSRKNSESSLEDFNPDEQSRPINKR